MILALETTPEDHLPTESDRTDILVDNLPYSDEIKRRARELQPPGPEQLTQLSSIADDLGHLTEQIVGKADRQSDIEAVDERSAQEAIFLRTRSSVQEIVQAVRSIDSTDDNVQFVNEAVSAVTENLPQLAEFMQTTCLGCQPTATGAEELAGAAPAGSSTLWGADYSMLVTAMNRIVADVSRYSEPLGVLVQLKKAEGEDTISSERAADLNGQLMRLNGALIDAIEPRGLSGGQANRVLTKLLETDVNQSPTDRISEQSTLITDIFLECCSASTEGDLPERVSQGIETLKRVLPEADCYMQLSCRGYAGPSQEERPDVLADALSHSIETVAVEAMALRYQLQPPVERPEEFKPPVRQEDLPAAEESTGTEVTEIKRVLATEDLERMRALTAQVQELALRVLRLNDEDQGRYDIELSDTPEEIVQLIKQIEDRLKKDVKANQSSNSSTGSYRPELRAVGEHLPTFQRCARELLIIEEQAPATTLRALQDAAEIREPAAILAEATNAVDQIIRNEDGIAALLIPAEERPSEIPFRDPDDLPADLRDVSATLTSPTARDTQIISESVVRLCRVFERIGLAEEGTADQVGKVAITDPLSLAEFAVAAKREAFDLLHANGNGDSPLSNPATAVLRTEAPRIREALRLVARGFSTVEADADSIHTEGVRLDARGQRYDPHFEQLTGALSRIEAAVENNSWEPPANGSSAQQGNGEQPKSLLRRLFSLGNG